MRYMILKGNWPCVYPSDLPTKDFAEAEVKRLEELRLKKNEAAKNWQYSGRGSAFMKPQHSDEAYTLKELPDSEPKANSGS